MKVLKRLHTIVKQWAW